MQNLRQQIEADLAESLEGEWKLPVEFTSPDGEVQKYKSGLDLNDPAVIADSASLLGGQVLYSSRRLNPNTGEVEVVDQPVVVLRISSLSRVPKNGETWFVQFPTSPRAGAPMRKMVFTATRAMEHGTDIGFIKIYPQQIEDEGAGPIS